MSKELEGLTVQFKECLQCSGKPYEYVESEKTDVLMPTSSHPREKRLNTGMECEFCDSICRGPPMSLVQGINKADKKTVSSPHQKRKWQLNVAEQNVEKSEELGKSELRR